MGVGGGGVDEGRRVGVCEGGTGEFMTSGAAVGSEAGLPQADMISAVRKSRNKILEEIRIVGLSLSL